MEECSCLSLQFFRRLFEEQAVSPVGVAARWLMAQGRMMPSGHAWPEPGAALLFIDWQRGFEDISRWGRERNNPAAEINAAALLQTWRGAGWPIWHVRHASQQKDSPLRPDAPGFAWQGFAEPRSGEPEVVKQVNSAFINTDLEQQLAQVRVRQLVISGVTTDHCVSTTTRMAANLGFDVWLVEDACFCFDHPVPGGGHVSAREVHEANIASLHGEFAQVVQTAALLKWLESPQGARGC